jgi:TRAP-type C4-dicarboxylate transport system permease small subunit
MVKYFKLILTIFILSLMIWLGLVNALKIWHMRTMALGIPKTIPLLSVPVGLALLLAIFLLIQYRKFREGSSE